MSQHVLVLISILLQDTGYLQQKELTFIHKLQNISPEADKPVNLHQFCQDRGWDQVFREPENNQPVPLRPRHSLFYKHIAKDM